MNIKDYIATGILELYVAGSLSEKENEEVHNAILENPELLAEVKSIENAIVQLTAFAKKDAAYSFNDIKGQLAVNEPKVIPLTKPKSNWKTYVGWAAAIVFGSTLILSIKRTISIRKLRKSNFRGSNR
jgi:anti-sigma-K factor RskA